MYLIQLQLVRALEIMTFCLTISRGAIWAYFQFIWKKMLDNHLSRSTSITYSNLQLIEMDSHVFWNMLNKVTLILIQVKFPIISCDCFSLDEKKNEQEPTKNTKKSKKGWGVWAPEPQPETKVLCSSEDSLCSRTSIESSLRSLW